MIRRIAGFLFVTAFFSLLMTGQLNGQETGGEETQNAQKESSREALLIFAEAASYQNNKQFDLAAVEWAKFLDKHRDDPRATEVLYNLAICQIQQSGFKEASENLDRVVEKNDPNFERMEDAYLNLGWSQYSVALQNQPEWFETASKTFEKMLAKYPQSKFRDQALFFGGESLYLQGMFEDAVKSYAELVEKHDDSPLHADAMYALGVTMEDLRRYKDAGEIFDAFLKSYPKHDLGTEVRMRKAETILQQGDFDTAEKLFKQVAAVDTYRSVDHAKYRYAFCIAAKADALAKKDGNKSVEQQRVGYRKAAEIFADIAENMKESPYANDATMAAGRSYYRANEFVDASRWFERVIETKSSNSPEAAHWRARIYLKAGEPVKARDVVSGVMNLAEESESDFLVNLKLDDADALYKDDTSKKESVAAYLRIADEHPKHRLAPKAIYNAAYGAMEVKDYRSGLAYAERFNRDYPNHLLASEVQKVVAECKLQLGQLDEAAAEFQNLVDSGDKEAVKFQLRRGLSLYLKKDYDAAIETFKAVLKSAKTKQQKAESSYWLGRALADSNQFEKANEAFAQSFKTNPNAKKVDDLLVNHARVLKKLGKTDEAKSLIQKMISEHPNSKLLDQAFYRLGEFAYSAADYSDAYENYSKVLEGYPESNLVPFALYGRGWSQLRAGKQGAGSKDFTLLTQDFPDHELYAKAVYGRGMSEHQNGNHEAGLISANAYLEKDPNGASASDAKYLKGICLVGLKKIPDAVEVFSQLLKSDPDYSGKDKVLYELAWAYKNGKDASKALETFESLVSIVPNSPLAAEANYHLGESLYTSKSYSESVEKYQLAQAGAKTKDLREKAAYKLGWAHYQTKDYDEAIAAFDQQLKTNGKGNLAADAEFMRAECFFKKESYGDALKAYTRAKKNPSKNTTMQCLTLLHGGQAAGQLKRWQNSYDWLYEIRDQFPKSPYLPQATYELGWAQRNLNKLEDALKTFTAVATTSRNELGARSRFMIGEILFEQKKYPTAILEFRRVMFGFGGDKAPEGIRQWQAKSAFEAGRCASILAGQNVSQRLDLLKASQSFFRYVVEKHPRAPEAKSAQEELAKLGSIANQARR